MPDENKLYYARRAEEPDDQRTKTQRDRDRILYSTAFRRLAGVTQVVGPSEGHRVHNRLTHTLEVAQVARALAERLSKSQGKLAWEAHDGIDPNAVEAAALAHDLGHPPFGHVCEEELDELVRAAQVFDGYEGNAQSFRIVTRLAVRFELLNGLNLTRLTLNAILKYPWLRTLHGKGRNKWGAYLADKESFDWTRKPWPPGDDNLSIEAHIMTWADDIAYSIHDLEDFYRAGLIPLERLTGGSFKSEDEISGFLSSVFERLADEGEALTSDERQLRSEAFRQFCGSLEASAISEPYRGTTDQRRRLRRLTTSKIRAYILGTRLTRNQAEPLRIDPLLRAEMKMLKQLTWHYVIKNPSLLAQQHGYRLAVRTIWAAYMDAVHSSRPSWSILPPRYKEEMHELADNHGPNTIPHDQKVRLVADAISGMTDSEALAVVSRLTGVLPGSIRDPIVL